MAVVGYLQLSVLCEYFNRVVYCYKCKQTWPVHRTLVVDLLNFCLFLALLSYFIKARETSTDGLKTTKAQNTAFYLPDRFLTVSVILIISTAIKLLTQLASTSTYGQLIYLLRDLLQRIMIFAVLVMFEIFCFSIVAIMFNADQEDNTIGVNLSELFRALF